MAKPFTFSTKRAGGNIYVQFAFPMEDEPSKKALVLPTEKKLRRLQWNGL
ncbi:hypothetical protein [Treponema sp.]